MKKLLPIILLSFVNVIGFSLLIPVLPPIIDLYYSGEHSGIIYGALLSSYALMQFFASPVLGAASDKYGRRKLLVISQAGTLLSWVIFGVAYFIPGEMTVLGASLPLLIIAFSRVVDGITGGNISVAQAWLTDVTSAEERTKAFGMLGATFGIGFLVGPVLGGFSTSTSYGYFGSVVLAFALSLITLAYIILKLPESLPKDKCREYIQLNLKKDLNFFSQLKIYDATPDIKSLLPTRISLAVVFAAFTTMITLALTEDYALSPIGLGLVLSLIGVFAIFHQGYMVPKIAAKIGDRRAFIVGIVMLVFALATLSPIVLIAESARVLSFVFFYVNAFFLNLGISLASTTYKSLMTQRVDEKIVGQANGIDESISSFGQGVSPIAGGLLFSLVGAWSFIVLAALLTLPALKIHLRK